VGEDDDAQYTGVRMSVLPFRNAKSFTDIGCAVREILRGKNSRDMVRDVGVASCAVHRLSQDLGLIWTGLFGPGNLSGIEFVRRSILEFGFDGNGSSADNSQSGVAYFARELKLLPADGHDHCVWFQYLPGIVMVRCAEVCSAYLHIQAGVQPPLLYFALRLEPTPCWMLKARAYYLDQNEHLTTRLAPEVTCLGL